MTLDRRTVLSSGSMALAARLAPAGRDDLFDGTGLDSCGLESQDDVRILPGPAR